MRPRHLDVTARTTFDHLDATADGGATDDDDAASAVTGAAAADSLPDEEPVEDDGADGDGGTVSISGRDLRVTTVVLALFGPYSAWVAYRDPNVVSITVAIAGIVLFVLALATLLIGLFAQPLLTLSERAADELINHQPYVTTVLGGEGA